MHTNQLITILLLIFPFSVLTQAAEQEVVNRDYEDAQEQIGRKFYEEKSKCEQLDGTRKKICIEKAEAAAKIAQEELDASQEGDVKNHIETANSKLAEQYDVDKLRCETLAGDAKNLCLEKAKNKYDKAKADAELREQSYDAFKQKNKKQNEADYKLEMKKCGLLEGNLKKTCEAQAREKYKQ